ncbi:unnamed protein product [Cercospora beticola]|nr:unnamed protein product [Cercospora beticola]
MISVGLPGLFTLLSMLLKSTVFVGTTYTTAVTTIVSSILRSIVKPGKAGLVFATPMC